MSELSTVLRQVIDGRLFDFHVALPGRVEKYDAATQKADVYPLVRGMREVADGQYTAEPNPVIPSVPVVFPGSGGYRSTTPVSPGDTVLLIFSEASLDKWLHRGGDVDPEDPRRNHMSDAIAIPGLHPFNAAWTGAGSGHMTMGKDGGAQVVITDSEVRLGGEGASQKAVCGDAYRSAEDAYFGALEGALLALATTLTATAAALATSSASGGTALSGAGAALAEAVKAAKAAFAASKPSHLSNTVKVQP
jgi:hypothetical protein